MVILFPFLLITTLLANSNIKDLIGVDTYNKNRILINKIFQKNMDYREIINQLDLVGINYLKVKRGDSVKFHFIFIDNPILALNSLKTVFKIIGVQKYNILSVKKESSKLKIEVTFITGGELNLKRIVDYLTRENIKIEKIKQNNKTDFLFILNLRDSFLDCRILPLNQKIILNNKNGVYLFRVEKRPDFIKIDTIKPNSWRPKIVLYDKNFKVLNLFKETNKIIKHVELTINNDVKYIEIADYFTKKNIKNGLKLFAQ